MRAPIQIVLAEDNLLVREGLIRLLAHCREIELAGAASSVPELHRLIETEAPNVVVTDIRMPPGHEDGGIRCAQSLRQTHPHVGVVVLSAFAHPSYAAALFADGTARRAYLLKDRVAESEYLFDAIRAVDSGGSFIDDQVVEVLARSRSRAQASSVQGLSPRERAVLAELATGRSNAAIAESLSVSRHAVEKHTTAIFAKLGLGEEHDCNRRVKAVLHYLRDVSELGDAPVLLADR